MKTNPSILRSLTVKAAIASVAGLLALPIISVGDDAAARMLAEATFETPGTSTPAASGSPDPAIGFESAADNSSYAHGDSSALDAENAELLAKEDAEGAAFDEPGKRDTTSRESETSPLTRLTPITAEIPAASAPASGSQSGTDVGGLSREEMVALIRDEVAAVATAVRQEVELTTAERAQKNPTPVATADTSSSRLLISSNSSSAAASEAAAARQAQAAAAARTGAARASSTAARFPAVAAYRR